MLLIPAGNFMMGSSTEGRADEEPVHQVSLDAFYLDKYEVTNKLFQKFVHETGYETTAEKEGRAAAVTSGGQWEVIPGANWRKPEGRRDGLRVESRGASRRLRLLVRRGRLLPLGGQAVADRGGV